MSPGQFPCIEDNISIKFAHSFNLFHSIKMSRRSIIFILLPLFLSMGCSAGRLSRSPSKTESPCDKQADLYLERGDWDKAIESHERFVLENPDCALAHYHLGYAYGFKGKHQREIDEYERAIELGLKKYDLFYNLGMVYAEYRTDYDKALEAFKQAEGMDPENDEIHYALALAYWFKEAESDAVVELLKTINLNPRHLEAHSLLGEIYFQRGQYDFAKAEWEIILGIDPKNEMARKRLEQIRNLAPR